MASYERYLKELGHTTDNVVKEKVVPLKSEIKFLSDKLKSEKQENLTAWERLEKECLEEFAD